ncbi:unnamed protein product [Oikopleura dioica]|uniref:Uncharacterized protein n=1 Tax=Oikopleura dioica TaxID=34765 RepID=E4X2F5_OIKDI|nr:unnamed protein product [Oikopleura dioica]
MSDNEEINEEFFAREENPEFIAEREYRRPTSRQEKIRHGLEGEPLSEREVYQPARRQFERTLANYVEEATKEKHELTLEAWGKAMLEASQKLSRLVRATIRGIREEYRQKPELVFNDFMLKARARVELPALWISLYLEEGQEKFDLSEPTYAARVEEIKERAKSNHIKARVEWQNDEYRRKRAKVQKLAEKKKTNADMKAQGYPEEQRKHQLKFRMNTKDATTQTTTGKARTAALKQQQKQEAAQERPYLSLSKATEAQTEEDSGRSEITVIERRREPRNDRRNSQDTGFEDEQAVSTDEEAISTDEEEELQARRAHLKKEAEKKELEKARKEFKANLELQKKRMQERKAKSEQEAERWNNYQAENRNYLATKERRRALNEEAEEEARKGKTQPRVTLEKPIYKARENVESFCRLPGNHYGLTQEEASFYDKNRIATALTDKAAGRDYDQKVIDAWYGSDVRRMQNEMQEPRHRLYAYTRKAQWDLLPEGRYEPKPTNEDMQLVHYFFSFLNWEGIKRSFLEVIEGLFDSERLGQYMACTFRVGGKHLLHAYRCMWVYLYEHADFEVPAVHRDIAPQL